MRIWHKFGPEYGLRRVYLAAVTSIGVPLGYWVADHVSATPYYQLKRTLWKYAENSKATSFQVTVTKRPKHPAHATSGHPTLLSTVASRLGWAAGTVVGTLRWARGLILG